VFSNKVLLKSILNSFIIESIMKVLTHLAVLLISLAIAANCAYTPAMALQMGYMSAAAY
jgi:F0F1-type ATP synthase assembly protein I